MRGAYEHYNNIVSARPKIAFRPGHARRLPGNGVRTSRRFRTATMTTCGPFGPMSRAPPSVARIAIPYGRTDDRFRRPRTVHSYRRTAACKCRRSHSAPPRNASRDADGKTFAECNIRDVYLLGRADDIRLFVCLFLFSLATRSFLNYTTRNHVEKFEGHETRTRKKKT